MKKYTALLTALSVSVSALALPFGTVSAAGSYDMTVNVDLAGSTKTISPYIYGINQYSNEDNLKNVTVNALRQGGNRTTAYNWENNASNAGSDWLYSSDDNLSKVDDPADCVQTLSKDATTYGVNYKLATLQMAGYVAADKDGAVSEEEIAPSDRWNEVVFRKPTAFADEPDLTDGVVYMDEYVNYIVNKLGNSKSATGIQAYSLDNEPALWQHTHSRMHPSAPTIAEIGEKSIALASAVKDVDPDAEIFGPALYGYTAFDHLADDDASTEWETIQGEKGYNWYLDCYLDQMKQAEEQSGRRLLDVLDLHYYSESARLTAEDRVQSVRTLYEEGFAENSWIGEWCQKNIPLLPTIQKSIDKYYPGTKLAISEYNFEGENDCSGLIAQAEALGCFADAGVYYASLWSGGPFIYSGINLYTNYDGKGGHFGDLLVPTKTDDVSLASSYAAIDSKDAGVVTAMLTNKSMTDAENATIKLENSTDKYQGAAVYAVSGDSADIQLIDVITDVENNEVKVNLPAFSAAMVVITDDASDLEGLEVYDPNKIVKKTVTIDNPADYLNDKGYVVFPVEDAEHLVAINVTGDVSAELGSGWGSAGCALCINAVDEGGTGFWTSKSFTLGLGKGSTASILFDGTFDNDGTSVKGVIADGKIEIQKWWDASEKQEAGDVISVDYTKIELKYEYLAEPAVETKYGDVNCDDDVNVSDLIQLARFVAEDADVTPLTEQGKLNADCEYDGILNSDDIVIIARYLARLIPESEMGTKVN